MIENFESGVIDFQTYLFKVYFNHNITLFSLFFL